MVKRLVLAVETSVEQYESYRQVRVAITEDGVREWSLALVLLE